MEEILTGHSFQSGGTEGKALPGRGKVCSRSPAGLLRPRTPSSPDMNPGTHSISCRTRLPLSLLPFGFGAPCAHQSVGRLIALSATSSLSCQTLAGNADNSLSTLSFLKGWENTPEAGKPSLRKTSMPSTGFHILCFCQACFEHPEKAGLGTPGKSFQL